MVWDTRLYEKQHAFVTEYGKALFELFPQQQKLTVLDLGCGTGSLTSELARRFGRAIGIDASPEMVATAKRQYPDLEFYCMDACKLMWENTFDVIFSNAVFHWIPNQPKLLHCVIRALKPDGRLICEFGAHGNVSAIESALCSLMLEHKVSRAYVSFFPTADEYARLLQAAGFQVESIADFDRPTPLRGQENGLRLWLRQFREQELKRFPHTAQETVIQEMENRLRSKLWDGTQWVADYRRLRVCARRPSGTGRNMNPTEE